MFEFIKKVLVITMSFCSCNAISLNVVPLKYVKVNKYNGSCNNINDPYSKLCAPDVAENINVTAFNLMLI